MVPTAGVPVGRGEPPVGVNRSRGGRSGPPGNSTSRITGTSLRASDDADTTEPGARTTVPAPARPTAMVTM